MVYIGLTSFFFVITIYHMTPPFAIRVLCKIYSLNLLQRENVVKSTNSLLTSTYRSAIIKMYEACPIGAGLLGCEKNHSLCEWCRKAYGYAEKNLLC